MSKIKNQSCKWIVESALSVTAVLVLACNGWAQANAQKIDLDDVSLALRDPQWTSVTGISLNKNISFVFQVKEASEFQVEYYQRVLFFTQIESNGAFVGAFQLRMNTGGRTYVLVYCHTSDDGHLSAVTFEDRYGRQCIDLDNMAFRTSLPCPKDGFLGTLNGTTVPLRFESPVLLPEETARKPIDHFP